MNTRPVPGKYTTNWVEARITNPNFKCKCGSKNIMFREWESSCGGFEDTQYKCMTCNYQWWVESSDS
jgi:DNA-directed RNA polymerase subunit RPC12/RpoP